MSMQIDVTIDGETIALVEVTAVADDHSTEPDAVNPYVWTYYRKGARTLPGRINHRYGDGAIELARAVLAEIAARHRIAAEYGPDRHDRFMESAPHV